MLMLLSRKLKSKQEAFLGLFVRIDKLRRGGRCKGNSKSKIRYLEENSGQTLEPPMTIDYVSTSFSLVQRMCFLFPILFFIFKKNYKSNIIS